MEKVSEKKREKKLPGKSCIRIVCPECGNDVDFFEVAEGVVITTNYIQNRDGSFTQESDESQILGEIKFFCGECDADLSNFHQRFMEMLF